MEKVVSTKLILGLVIMSYPPIKVKLYAIVWYTGYHHNFNGIWLGAQDLLLCPLTSRTRGATGMPRGRKTALTFLPLPTVPIKK